jgi:hypothetical protein
MNAREFRAMADRCRNLQRVATRDDIREQLLQTTFESSFSKGHKILTPKRKLSK